MTKRSRQKVIHVAKVKERKTQMTEQEVQDQPVTEPVTEPVPEQPPVEEPPPPPPVEEPSPPAPVEEPMAVGNPEIIQDAASGAQIITNVEQAIERITATTTPQASAGVLIDWIVGALGRAIAQGGMAASMESIKEHVAELEAHKDALAHAVAAN